MTATRKTWERMVAGSRNLRFEDFIKVVEAFGCVHQRTSGSHRVYKHLRVPIPLSFQPVNGQAKPYQVRQFMSVVEEFGLRLGED